MSQFNLRNTFYLFNLLFRVDFCKLIYIEHEKSFLYLFQRIEGIEALVNLEELYLGQNKITKLENLNTLTKLKILSIQVSFVLLVVF